MQHAAHFGRYQCDGRPVSLRDISVPVFAVSATGDQVAPWRSVYKIQMLTNSDVTFVLSNGGHNAGIVNPPGHPRQHYQISTLKEGETYVNPDSWQQSTPRQEGSWWLCWQDWLAGHSPDALASPPQMGAAHKGYAPPGRCAGNVRAGTMSAGYNGANPRSGPLCLYAICSSCLRLKALR